ncbi:hypothetical protein ABID22_000397 [Pontibacter aydingkolensis]|uniref:Uncharacterized protein n=1 Tax=Pontibacter aydingkolensis TaxID=1911536 RepID=A0ABS7CQ19_9BACT|nr:hypothetical protein [Pontibacter aydingkolensis]MBW7465939.1 hypothetical protein [Pontibacter aydingkolensis]
MTNAGNYRGQGEENWRMGNKSPEQEREHQKRYGYRGSSTHNDKQWDEGNYFHTGPSPRGAQDTPEKRYGESYHHDRNKTYARERNAQLGEHYGSKPESPYRNERSYLDHGQGYQHSDMHTMRRPHTPGGSLQGNTSDVNDNPNDIWRDSPDSRSRYKETDFRYGSGSHNWYREGRYTSDENPNRDNRGFMDRVKDTWNDIWHSDDPEYRPRYQHQSAADRVDSHKRYGSEPYRDRRFDRGYEGGPRWADEVDSGEDNYYNDTDYKKRYQR